jgi:hypothetical protein
VAELETEEGKLKGSARGIPGIDLYQVLKANEHLMTKWGGHQMAAGYSAEAANADVLCRALVDTCNRMLEGQASRATLDIDLEIESKDLDLHLAKSIRQLGPFGMWNKKPVLAMRSLQVLNTRVLGKDGKHHRIVLRSFSGEGPFECVYWRSGGRIPVEGQEIDLAFNPEINVYNNNERLQLVLCDWRAAGAEDVDSDTEVMDFTPPQEAALAVGASSGAGSVGGTSNSNGSPLASSGVQDESAMLDGKVEAAIADDVIVHVETSYDGQTASTTVKGYTVIQGLSAENAAGAVSDPVAVVAGQAPPDTSPAAKRKTEQADFEPSHVVAADHLDNSNSEAAPMVGTSASKAKSKVDLPPMAASAPPLGESKSQLQGRENVPESRSSRAEALSAAMEMLTPQTEALASRADALPSLQIDGSGRATPSGGQEPRTAAQQLSFKDLREHGSSTAVIDAAARKLGDKLQIYAEACKLDGHKLYDRTAISETTHLLIWQFPPSLQVFRALIAKCKPQHIYLSGSGPADDLDAPAFLKKLLSLVRFAVNQKDGQAHADKLASALASTKMCLALGLTILKKLNVIDWYSEDSILYMDILGQPSDSWDSLPEYRQLSNSLREIMEFRAWCAEASLEEVQSELVPNAIRVSDTRSESYSQEAPSRDSNLRVNYDDERASYTSGH